MIAPSSPAAPATRYHLTRKVNISPGRACNCRCRFCYFRRSVDGTAADEPPSAELIVRRLHTVRRLGIREIEFTGGEPTLRGDLPGLVRRCKTELGFPLVSILTNGIVLADPDRAQEIIGAGIDDVLFSVHGHTSELHDGLTRTPGSHAKILMAMDNARRLGARIRTNTVLCSANYSSTYDITAFLADRGVDNINLVLFNPILQAKGTTSELLVPYDAVAPHILSCLERRAGRLPHLNIRYIPFCFLPGCEPHITNHDQFNFEPDEWNNYVSFRLRRGAHAALACALLGIADLRYRAFAAQFGAHGLLTAGMGRFYQLKNKHKPSACRQCAYEFVCDYLWNDYARLFGEKGVRPVPGPKLRNPVAFTTAATIRAPGELPRSPLVWSRS